MWIHCITLWYSIPFSSHQSLSWSRYSLSYMECAGLLLESQSLDSVLNHLIPVHYLTFRFPRPFECCLSYLKVSVFSVFVSDFSKICCVWYKLWSCSLCRFVHPPVSCSLLGLCTLLGILCTNTLNLGYGIMSVGDGCSLFRDSHSGSFLNGQMSNEELDILLLKLGPLTFSRNVGHLSSCIVICHIPEMDNFGSKMSHF
jgi:hypothetical protein